MGLDLILNVKNKRTDEIVEFSYGRKTWELAHMFPGAVGAMGEDVLVTKESYENVINTLSRFTLEEYSEIIADFETLNIFELDAVPSRLTLDFIEWYDSTFNESPTLGYGHAAATFKNWLLDYYEKADLYLNNQEWQMYISASF